MLIRCLTLRIKADVNTVYTKINLKSIGVGKMPLCELKEM